MIIRSRAPLRIGLAGGGTDVSPYSEIFGGAILNATVSLYACASLEPLDTGMIELVREGDSESKKFEKTTELPCEGEFQLMAGVYNRIVKQFKTGPLSFRLTTGIEAPQGSGLGTSSTLVVAILGAFVEWLNLPLGLYDIAHLAYEIERVDLAMTGGKQDQYAATFGGINFLEFFPEDKVIVNPLHLKNEIRNELEFCTLLYFTDTQRQSSSIISEQVQNVKDKNTVSVEAMHNLKAQAHQMKDCLLRGELDKVGDILHFGWQNKKKMAKSVSNPLVDNIYQSALSAGAKGGKISGAGGGGFMFFYCPGNNKISVARALEKFGGKVQSFRFTDDGLCRWKV